jgi:hypothetical protein
MTPSRIDTPLVREAVEASKRLSMSPARRARILALYGNSCAVAGCCVETNLELDHVICLEIGGDDADFNIEPLCTYHHRLKTARDATAIARARRLRKREAGETKSKRPIISRGFDKTLSRSFSGTVRKRSLQGSPR